MKAIVYTSRTGSTEKYAKLLSEKLNIPHFSLNSAKTRLTENSEIIYLGWIMGGKISGYKTAAKRYKIAAVCAVGVLDTREELLRNQNIISQNKPLFALPGNFNLQQLRGFYRFAVKLFIKANKNKTNMQNPTLEIMLQGKIGLDENKLAPVLEFCEEYKLCEESCSAKAQSDFRS